MFSFLRRALIVCCLYILHKISKGRVVPIIENEFREIFTKVQGIRKFQSAFIGSFESFTTFLLEFLSKGLGVDTMKYYRYDQVYKGWFLAGEYRRFGLVGLPSSSPVNLPIDIQGDPQGSLECRKLFSVEEEYYFYIGSYNTHEGPIIGTLVLPQIIMSSFEKSHIEECLYYFFERLEFKHGYSVREEQVYRAHTDDLTGLFNKRTLGDVSRCLLEVFDDKDENSVSLIFLDFDHFKDLNEKHGHLVADQVLSIFGDILMSSLDERVNIYIKKLFMGDPREKVDWRQVVSLLLMYGGCFPARFGGEEFALLFFGDHDNAYAFISQIGNEFQEKVSAFGKCSEWTPSFTGGLVQLSAEKPIDAQWELANQLLLEAKAQERGIIRSVL